MINLAGVEEADSYIKEELSIADIKTVEASKNTGEVPYSLIGKLGPWTLKRAWYYWTAHASHAQGLPLDIATEMHNREYPIKEGPRGREIYGQVIRVAGHCGCPPPGEPWVNHFDENYLELVLDPKGEQKAEYERFIEKGLRKRNPDFRFVKSLEGLVVKSVIDSYHIDTQLGLNEFAKTVKSLV